MDKSKINGLAQAILENGSRQLNNVAKQIDQVLATSPPESIPDQFTKECLVNATMNVYKLALSKAS